MAWLGSLFGGRKKREARERARAQIAEILEKKGPRAAWQALVQALEKDSEDVELLRLCARVLRMGEESATAELFDRAADAPHDPQRFFELGSMLLSSEQAPSAALMLERALAFVPFDAVVRSELALAYLRAGDPQRTVSTLALHPCLAEDEGALFSFGWASLLAGDLDAARGALHELHTAPALRTKLSSALARAEHGMFSEPPDVRDFFFVEYGGIVLDARGPLGGRYDALRVDAEWTSTALGSAAWVLRELSESPPRVIAIDEAHRPLASALARACGGTVIDTAPKKGRSARTVLPLLHAEQVDTLAREALAGGPLIFALVQSFERSISRAPDLVGAFTRNASFEDDAFEDRLGAERDVDATLRTFVEARKKHLPADDARAAYVPDEPLPRS